MEIKEELIKYQNIINEYLTQYLKSNNVLEKQLDEAVIYSVMAGGKRIRPILVLATYKLFKDDYEVCLPYAIAIELIHNFSLIHDDLPGIDNDDYRHGKLTNHKKYNEATAILAGDKLLNYGYYIVSQDLLNNQDLLENKIHILSLFSNAIDEMIRGEYLDTLFEKKNIEKEELEYIHQHKTGALIKLSVEMGALLANTTNDNIDKLVSYADKIGLAFQIKDDILSEEGDMRIIGKPVGNDRQRGKCTYVTKYGLEESKKMLNDLTNEAVAIIDEFGSKGAFLKELALYIANREK